MNYELVIVGGGPAGVAAGVYAERKKIRTLLVAESFGGQSIVSGEIRNWIGTKSISGLELAKALEEHLKAHQDIDILEGERVAKISRADGGFQIETSGGKVFGAKTIMMASGSRRRRLAIPGEDKFDGHGVSYCSICDAPLFKNKNVAVVGGGNSALEAVVDLLPYASNIYLLQHSAALKGDQVTQDRIAKEPKVKTCLNAETKEIVGDDMVKSLKYQDNVTKEIKELAVDGVFVEIGIVPNSELVKDLVQLNPLGEIVVDQKTQQSSLEGIWAAGDVGDALYKQNNISAGDAIKAILSIYTYLNKSK
ncbi:FAD-dependent oxidoreductase [Patescibacteria group bacterium]|nr:FAD-dependent oxidoreductase [Patescibacteria group bacterium]